jgi:hypothetical protein
LLSVENAVETESALARVVLRNGAVGFFAGAGSRYNYMKVSRLFSMKVNDPAFLDPWMAAPCIWVLHSFAAALYE